MDDEELTAPADEAVTEPEPTPEPEPMAPRRIRLPDGGVVRFWGDDEALARKYPGAEVLE